MNTHYLYPVDLETDEDGRVVARLPDLVGCVTNGADRAEALCRATDALEESLAHLILAGEPAPSPRRRADVPALRPAP